MILINVIFHWWWHTLDKTLIGKQKWERRNIMAKGDNHSTEWTLLQTHTVQPGKVTHNTMEKNLGIKRCCTSNCNVQLSIPLALFQRFSVPPSKFWYGCFYDPYFFLQIGQSISIKGLEWFWTSWLLSAYLRLQCSIFIGTTHFYRRPCPNLICRIDRYPQFIK